MGGFHIAYHTDHPPDPEHWTDYLTFSLCMVFLAASLLVLLLTLVFALQKRLDILLKCPLAIAMMCAGACMHVVATCVSYLPLYFLQSGAAQACVLFDYWLTLGGVALWCIGNSISITNNVLGCIGIIQYEVEDRMRGFPSNYADKPAIDRALSQARRRADMSMGERIKGLSEDPLQVNYGDEDEDDDGNTNNQRMSEDDAIDMEDYMGSVLGGSSSSHTMSPPPPPSSSTKAPIANKHSELMVHLGTTFGIDIDDEASSRGGRWSHQAVMNNSGGKLLGRFGCAWRFGVPPIRLRTFSSKIMAFSILVILGVSLVALLMSGLAQAMHASQPVKYKETGVIECQSPLGFKFSMALIMTSYVVLSWVQLFMLRRKHNNSSVVPQFCYSEYARMMMMLTAMFAVTLVVNLFGATNYYWGRALYIALLLALYSVSYYCMVGKCLRNFLGRNRNSDRQIIWQLCEFSIPTDFSAMMVNDSQREFIYRDFGAWMTQYARPAYIPDTMLMGSLESSSDEAWQRTTILPFEGSAVKVADDHHLVFPLRLFILFEASARYLQRKDGSDLLPFTMALTNDYNSGDASYVQLEELTEVMEARRSRDPFLRMRAWLARLARKITRSPHQSQSELEASGSRYVPVGKLCANHVADVLAKHFLHTALSLEEQTGITRQLASTGPGDSHYADLLSRRLPTIPCDGEYYRTMMNLNSHQDPQFLGELNGYIVRLFDNYFFPLFMRHERAVRKFSDIDRTNQALTDMFVEQVRDGDITSDPFGDEHDSGLSTETDSPPPEHLHRILGYLPQRHRRRLMLTGNMNSLELPRDGSYEG